MIIDLNRSVMGDVIEHITLTEIPCLLSLSSNTLTMPETRFLIQWPDGQQTRCYSPSSVVHRYFEAGQAYRLTDFVARAKAALMLASDRVQSKYGRPCGLALGQLQELETLAQQFADTEQAKVHFIRFMD